MNRPLRRGVIILPSTLTLANLFFGVWAIVAAAEGRFETAAWLIVAAGVADMLDGRVARVTRTGTRFGAELDSLVDAISFGVAPALIVYHLVLADGRWGWTAAFLYVLAAVVRLARFNVEQAGHARVAFHGLPSPAAGMTLATFYPFSQTALFQQYLAAWPWATGVAALMVALAALMVSHVLYPVVPKFGFRNARGILTLLGLLAAVAAAVTVPALVFFPALLVYVVYGVVKALVLGFFERLPERDLLLDGETPDDADAELRDIDYDELAPPARLWTPFGRRVPPRRPRPGRGQGGRAEESPSLSETEEKE